VSFKVQKQALQVVIAARAGKGEREKKGLEDWKKEKENWKSK
jgi:hypothetical protein